MKQNVNHKIYYILILLSTLTIFVLTYNNGGIWSTDTLNYFAAAKNLLQSKSFLTYNGKPYILWPPLYPTLLFIGLKTGISILHTAVIINAIAFTITCILFYKTLTFFSTKNQILLSFVFATMFYSTFLTVFTRALTESLFIALAIAYTYCMVFYINTSKNTYLILSSLIVAFACLQRYLGVTLVISGIVTIFILSNNNIYKKLKATFIFLFLSTTPLFFWLFRNYQLTKTLTGPRFGKARYGIKTAILDLTNTISTWIIRKDILNISTHNTLLNNIVFIVLITSALATIYYLIKTKKLGQKNKISLTKTFLYVHLLFIFFYLALLMYLSVNTNVDRINTRLLSPIYPSIFTFIFALLTSQIDKTLQHQQKKPILIYSIILIMFINTLYTLPSFAKKYIIHKGQWGYQTNKWQTADISIWLRNNKLDGKLFSNRPEFAFYNSGQSTFSSPYSKINLFSLNNVLENSYLIWFNIDKEKFRHTPKDIEKYFNMRLVKKFNKGTIYRIEGKN